MTTNQYRVLITGSRDWARWETVTTAIRATEHTALARGLSVVIVEGGCPEGADFIARMYARGRGWEVETHDAEWDACAISCPPNHHRRTKQQWDRMHPGKLADYCPGAGPRRNAAMVASGADVCLAFIRNHSWGATGCANKASRAGIAVHRFTDCSCHPSGYLAGVFGDA